MSADYYYTVEKPAIAEFKDRGSKFIAFVFPVETVQDFKEKMAAVKKEHPKATHHCFAYRMGTDGNLFRSSDDGEPSGTAGKPILGQIDSRQVTNVLVIVVRYFGGTLLGVPGLIHAYRTAAALALQLTPVIHKPVLIRYGLQFDYTQINEVMKIIRQTGSGIVKQDLQLFCAMEIGIQKSRLEETLNRLKELKGVELKPAES